MNSVIWYRVRMKKRPVVSDKGKLSVSVSRPSLAVLDRIRAKRIEEGHGRRQAQPGRLIEEAIELLRKKERV